MNIRDRFNAKFGLPYDGFLSPVNFNDAEIGFSVRKTREEPEFESLFKVYIRDKDLKGAGKLKPVIVGASYGKKIGGEIVIASSEFERKINWPIELISEGEFFYNIETDDLYYKEQLITGPELLNKIEEWHTKPTKLFRGFILRTKLAFWREWVIHIPSIFIELLYLVSGDRITKNIWERKAGIQSTVHFTSKIPKEKESERLNIFGYRASLWAVMFYFLLHIGILLVAQKYKIEIAVDFFTQRLSNNFLILTYTIPTLVIIDRLLPKILRYLISKTTDFAVWASYKKIKI